SLNRKVALKVLKAGLGLTTQAVTRFRREAAAAAKLHHTNIVPIYATGEDGDHYFYAMELIEGPSLDRVIPRLREERDSSVPPEVISLIPKPTNDQLHAGADNLRTTEPDGGGTVEPKPEVSATTTTSLETGSGYFDTVARLFAEMADGLDHAHKQ